MLRGSAYIKDGRFVTGAKGLAAREMLGVALTTVSNSGDRRFIPVPDPKLNTQPARLGNWDIDPPDLGLRIGVPG
jgi:hypothetical protein